jgi:hypothetical protein
MLVRIIQVLLAVALVGIVALAGYAFLGDLSPEKHDVEVPVTLTPG